ncbi:hypothetical protein DA2_2632 [Desulfovibrio sp. A2]|nr:hypothetical protein DA2_2632 [Desulfovibrio sp. A2]
MACGCRARDVRRMRPAENGGKRPSRAHKPVAGAGETV